MAQSPMRVPITFTGQPGGQQPPIDPIAEIHQLLQSSSPEDAQRLLSGLSDQELDDYEDRYGGGPVAETPVPPSVVAPPETNQFADLSDEELAARERQLELELEGEQNKSSRTGGFLDSGMGMAVSSLGKGLAAIPALGIDYGVAPLLKAATGIELPKTGEALENLDDLLGVRKPSSGTDRVVASMLEGIGAAGGGVKVGKELLNASPTLLGKAGNWLGKVLSSQPGLQAAGGATAGASQALAAEKGADQTEQLIAALAGGMVPSAALAGGGAALRGAVRGGETGRQNIADALADYAAAGTTPTVGQATGSRGARSLESRLSRFFGSSGRMLEKSREQGQELGGAVGDVADALAGQTTPTQMGERLVSEFENKFQPAAKAEIGRSYSALERILPQGTVVKPTNFQKFLADKTAPTPGAEKSTTNPAVRRGVKDWQSLLQDVEADIATNNRQGLSLGGLKEIRSGIGDQLSEGILRETELPQKDLRAAYAALSRDMEDAARASGNPNALTQFQRANVKAKQYFDHLEQIKTVLDKRGGGEKIFQAAISGTKEGASTLEAVYKTLSPEAKQTLSGVIIRRAMRATPSEENLVGPAAFDLSTFARNFNGLGAAKEVVLQGMGKAEREGFERILKIVDDVQATVNDFGAARTVAEGQGGRQMAVYGAAAALGGGLQAAHSGAGIGTGLSMLASAGIVMGGSNLLARAMTSPRLVRFLGERTNLPPAALATALQQFARNSDNLDDADIAEEMSNSLKEPE